MPAFYDNVPVGTRSVRIYSKYEGAPDVRLVVGERNPGDVNAGPSLTFNSLADLDAFIVELGASAAVARGRWNALRDAFPVVAGPSA